MLTALAVWAISSGLLLGSRLMMRRAQVKALETREQTRLDLAQRRAASIERYEQDRADIREQQAEIDAYKRVAAARAGIEQAAQAMDARSLRNAAAQQHSILGGQVIVSTTLGQDGARETALFYKGERVK